MTEKDIGITVKKNKKIYYPYCKKCNKPAKPVRQINNDLYFHLWIISIFASLGILLPVFLIYHFHVKKKLFCEFCSNKIKFYDSPDRFPGSIAQIERIVKEIKDEVPETYLCRYCHEKIENKTEICPHCGTKLK